MAEAAVQTSRVEQNAVGVRGVSLGREMGFWAVLVFSFSSFGLAYSGLIPFSIVAGQYPGSSLLGIITVGTLVSLIHAYTYAVIGTVASRYGSDYLVASRVLNAPLAFASSWTLVIFLSLGSGSFVASLAQDTIPMFAQILSLILADRSILNSAHYASTPSGIVLIGTIGVVVVFLMLIAPPKVTRLVLSVGFVLILLAWGIISVQMASAPSGSFQGSYDFFMGEGSYMRHLKDAQRLGMAVNYDLAPMASAGLLMGYWIFYGYFNPAFFSGEVKKPERNLLLGVWTALLVAWGLMALTMVLLQRLVPAEWLSAESYLHQSSQYSGLTMPWLPFFGAILQPSPILTGFVGIAWIYTILNMAHAFLYSASRVVFVWAEDHLLPGSMTFIHPTLRSPLVPVLLVCIIAELGVVNAALSGDDMMGFNPLLFMVGVQVIPILAVTLLPYLRRDWFDTAPTLVRYKIGPLPVITLVGALSLLYLIGMTTANYFYNIFGGISQATFIFFGLTFLSGLAWFFGRRYYLKAQGEDISLRLKQLPEK